MIQMGGKSEKRVVLIRKGRRRERYIRKRGKRRIL